MPFRRLLTLLLGLSSVFAFVAPLAAKPVRNGAVVAELVSADASIQQTQNETERLRGLAKDVRERMDKFKV